MRGGQNPLEFREIELKLEVDPGDVNRLRAHPFLRSADTAAQKLTNIYFDTGKHALRDNGITLGVRHDGGSYTQTIKAERPTTGLALDRSEWEHQLPSAEPDFEQADGTPLEPFLRGKGSRQKVRSIFTITSERVVSTLNDPGSVIELALETAWIEAGKSSGFVCGDRA